MSDTNWKKITRQRLLLLAVGLLTLFAVLVIIVFIFLPKWLNDPPLAEVQANASRYDKAAKLIESGEIAGKPTGGEIVMLPQEYKDLSPARDGEVIIYREGTTTQVLFYLHSLTSLTTWVYMYSSDDKPMDLHGECSGTERERPNWYIYHCP